VCWAGTGCPDMRLKYQICLHVTTEPELQILF